MEQASEHKVERLQARLTPDQKALIAHAAEIEGRSLTDFVVSTATQTAKKVIEDQSILRLSVADQKTFADALSQTPEVGGALARALDRHAQRFPDEA